MEIKIHVFGATYSICFGYKTPWFESVSFITIAREWHGKNKQVEYAKLIVRT